MAKGAIKKNVQPIVMTWTFIIFFIVWQWNVNEYANKRHKNDKFAGETKDFRVTYICVKSHIDPLLYFDQKDGRMKNQSQDRRTAFTAI